LWPGQRGVLTEAPSSCGKPVLDLVDALDVAVAEMDRQLAGHERGVQRTGCVRGRALRRPEDRTRWRAGSGSAG
jgi:hypothetical protein